MKFRSRKRNQWNLEQISNKNHNEKKNSTDSEHGEWASLLLPKTSFHTILLRRCSYWHSIREKKKKRFIMIYVSLVLCQYYVIHWKDTFLLACVCLWFPSHLNFGLRFDTVLLIQHMLCCMKYECWIARSGTMA